MRIIEPTFEIMFSEDFERGDILQRTERIARTCYKSEDKMLVKRAEEHVDYPSDPLAQRFPYWKRELNC